MSRRSRRGAAVGILVFIVASVLATTVPGSAVAQLSKKCIKYKVVAGGKVVCEGRRGAPAPPTTQLQGQAVQPTASLDDLADHRVDSFDDDQAAAGYRGVPARRPAIPERDGALCPRTAPPAAEDEP